MLVIRLSRKGAKKRPFYHINLADSRRAPSGRFIENLGFFDPLAKGHETRIKLNKVRFEYWLNQGAQPSDTLKNLLKKPLKQDLDTAEKDEADKLVDFIFIRGEEKPVRRTKANKKKAAEAEAASEAASTEPVAEESSAEAPSAEPVAEESSAEAPSAEPVAEESSAEAPSAEPATEEAKTEAASAESATEEADSDAPSTEPVTEEADTEAPSAEPATEEIAEEVAETEAKSPEVEESTLDGEGDEDGDQSGKEDKDEGAN